MTFTVEVADFDRIKVPSLVVFCCETSMEDNLYLKGLNASLAGSIANIFQSGEFAGRLNQSIVIHTHGRYPSDRIILAGLGEKARINHDHYRQAAGSISTLPAIKNSPTIAFFLATGEDKAAAGAIVEGFMLGRFSMADYKSRGRVLHDRLKRAVFYLPKGPVPRAFRKAINSAEIISEGVIQVRRLAARPGNILTPRRFAVEATSLARKYGLKSTVFDEKKIAAERMEALLAVARGSKEPPRFIIIKYRGTVAGSRPIVLIGKGITFDSGGVCLKKPEKMLEMKGDMQGGAIVLSTLITAARLKLPLNVVGLIPLAENMPSGSALKPGDIIKSRKGLTIEIINTDAEGRLILADALSYAGEFFPRAVIDIATLSGAALYVLGYSGAPILGNNRQLLDAIRAASEAAAEKVWELPLWDEYRSLMNSSIADLKNSAGKPAGTITAAAFLENFVGKWPWAHIDIAYVDVEHSGRPYIPKGHTGIGLRLLVKLLIDWKDIK
jgi:leucyl aminopeptidase